MQSRYTQSSSLHSGRIMGISHLLGHKTPKLFKYNQSLHYNI